MHRRAVRTALAVVALLGATAFASPASAQNGSIRGVVTDAGSNTPVADVQVTITGSDRGALTNANGTFRIDNVPAGPHELRARRIGFSVGTASTRVEPGQEVVVTIALRQAATQLGEVVVTGTPLAQERRSIGNAITTLDVANITEKSVVNNITEVLQSKTPGVQILPGSGVAGTSGEIRIRGASSISGYRPVIYIDGVRYNDGALGNFNPTGSGLAGQAQSAQATSALDLLSPEVIESIEVIKGPAAATLYGAEAANGVIQIITKKGMRGQQRLRWGLKYERGSENWALPTPVTYTTCDSVKKAPANAATWPGCAGVAERTILTDDPMRRDTNALRTGEIEKVNITLRGGGDRYSFFLSGVRDRNLGVYLNNFNNRRSVQANFTVTPSDKADFNVNLGYGNNRFRLPYQDESANALLLSAARGKPGRVSVVGEGWSTINPLQSNRYNNVTTAERFTMSGQFNYRPISWFRNRLTAGLDYTSTLAELLAPPGAIEDPAGFTAMRTPRSHLYTLDYAGSILRTLFGMESTTSFGSQVIARRDETLSGTGSGLGAPDVTLIGTATTTSATNSYSEANSVGYFVQEQLGLNKRLFLTGAIRMDDHSSFGKNFDAIVYPKLSMSWVLSEEPRFSRLFDNIKAEEFRFRAAWGQAGRAPPPYSAVQTYTIDKVVQGTTVSPALRTQAIGNPNLKPERGSEIELGFDAGFFRRRIGVDLTYYRKSVTDMLVSVGLPASTGFGSTVGSSTVGSGSEFRNLGEVRNSGVELGLDLTPFQSRPVTWESRISASTNRNELISFGDTLKRNDTPSGQAYATVQQHRPGYPLGGYWVQLPLRDENGRYRYTIASGQTLNTATITLDTARTYIGPSTPTREIGFTNTFTFFNQFRVYALLDMKSGHHLFNLKEFNRCGTANDNCALVNDPFYRFALRDRADTTAHLELLARRQVSGLYVEDASFVKLRDLSFGWTVPARFVNRLGASGAVLTLAGHNLALWSDYSGLDPEVNSYGGRNFVRADAYASPMFKRWTMSLNLTY